MEDAVSRVLKSAPSVAEFGPCWAGLFIAQGVRHRLLARWKYHMGSSYLGEQPLGSPTESAFGAVKREWEV